MAPSISFIAAEENSAPKSEPIAQSSWRIWEEMKAEKLGKRDFQADLCTGFRLLVDPQLGLITPESLKRTSGLLGLDSLTDSEKRAMMSEGDSDSDGALHDQKLCVLIIRLSPSFMAKAEKWLYNVVGQHEADLLPLAVNRYKQPRSGLDLPDPDNNQSKRQDPRALELWSVKGQRDRDASKFNHPIHCTFKMHDSVGVMGLAQALFTNLTPQISEGAIWHEDSLNTKQWRTDPAVVVAATSPDPRFQIIIKPPSGKSALIWVQALDSVSNLKKNIANHIGLPEGYQHLLSEGRSLQDHKAIDNYNIKPGSNIILNMRLRGGAAASGPRKQTEGGSGSKAKHSPEPHQ